jgi:hypothetical protein
MTDLLRVIFAVLASLFKSRAEVEAEKFGVAAAGQRAPPADAQAAGTDKH